MKKIFKKEVIIAFIIGIILASSIAVYAYSYAAKDISYTKPGTDIPISVEKALNELYNKRENCTVGIYHHDGKTNKYSIETNIDYKAIYLSTYVQNSDLYLNWYYNGNISNNYYQTHHFGLNGNYTAQNKNNYMSKSGTKFIYETSENNWAEFVNPVDVYGVAFE